ncbi:sodium-dependent nutrient amino acid transporter 1-like isoform X2 [Portunus trituberculatus]|uniref:sodium-dependent nutrient amino acid transporter 1-like isoform X2 n=1 Tax=Portunus trituberculatus TaxID=210409 RepID=UPI001E1CDB43|nr:sodium-dependent nutrient amino acid transporter 1-like isoform X2 [Portunus trituberculatus]
MAEPPLHGDTFMRCASPRHHTSVSIMTRNDFSVSHTAPEVARDEPTGVVNQSYVRTPEDLDSCISDKDEKGSYPTKPEIYPVKAPNEEEGKEEDGEERQQWSYPIEFLLSCISMSVGLGNIWRFPITAFQNGGGAFLIPYLIVLIFIGRPLYFLEMSIGQFSSFTCVKVWRMVPAAKGVGYGQMIGSWCVVTYYCSLMALTVFYFIMSFNKVLPWSVCDDAWADNNCVDASNTNVSLMNNSQSSSEQYYYKYVLRMKDDISDGVGLPDWRLTLCLLFSWVVVFLTMAKGVKSSGKVWYAAVTQSFFSLSVGFGAIINFSSYNKFSHNVYRDSWIISLTDTFTSLLAGFTIFAILGNLAYQLDTDIEDVVRSGGGLAFVSYPDALAKFTWAPQLFAVLFFLMLFTLGIGSAVGLAGCTLGIISDRFPSISKFLLSLGISVVGFLCGLVYITPGGQWIVDLVDFFGGGFIVYVIVTTEIIAVSYIYGFQRIFRDLRFMFGFDIDVFTKICWGVITPVALFGIFIYSLVTFRLPTYDGQVYPEIAYTCGWILTGLAVGMIPICFAHTLYHTPGDTWFERLRGAFKPKHNWGPKRAEDRKEWNKLDEPVPLLSC